MSARSWCVPTALGIALTLLGCSMQQQTAQRAIAAAEQALEMAGPAAQRYVPDLYQGAMEQLTRARTAFEAKLYKDALAEAQGAGATAAELPAAITAKKEELAATWTGLNDSLPALLETLQTRVNAMSRGGRMPAGVTRAKVAEARTALGEMKQSWTQATAGFASGNVLEAVTTGQQIQARAGEIMTSLGMTVAAR